MQLPRSSRLPSKLSVGSLSLSRIDEAPGTPAGPAPAPPAARLAPPKKLPPALPASRLVPAKLLPAAPAAAPLLPSVAGAELHQGELRNTPPGAASAEVPALPLPACDSAAAGRPAAQALPAKMEGARAVPEAAAAGRPAAHALPANTEEPPPEEPPPPAAPPAPAPPLELPPAQPPLLPPWLGRPAPTDMPTKEGGPVEGRPCPGWPAPAPPEPEAPLREGTLPTGMPSKLSRLADSLVACWGGQGVEGRQGEAVRQPVRLAQRSSPSRAGGRRRSRGKQQGRATNLMYWVRHPAAQHPPPTVCTHTAATWLPPSTHPPTHPPTLLAAGGVAPCPADPPAEAVPPAVDVRVDVPALKALVLSLLACREAPGRPPRPAAAGQRTNGCQFVLVSMQSSE